MNRRNLIKAGLATISASVIPEVFAEKVNRIGPPLIYNVDDLNFFTDSDHIKVVAKTDNQYDYIYKGDKDLSFDGLSTREKIHEIFCSEYNRGYFMEKYLPDAKVTVETSNYIYNFEERGIAWTEILQEIENFADILPLDTTFIVATPKICTLLQLQKSFVWKPTKSHSHHEIIGSIKDVVVYRDVTTEDMSDYLLTDSHMFRVDLYIHLV